MQHGRVVPKRPTLPVATKGQGTSVYITPTPPLIPLSITSPVVAGCIAAKQDPDKRLKVAVQLRNPHPAVQQLMEELSAKRPDEYGRVGTASIDRFTSLVISVSLTHRSRALRVLDALVKALTHRGYEVSDKGAVVEGQTIPLGIFERSGRFPHILTPVERARQRQGGIAPFLPKWDYAASGRLTIATERAFGRRSGIRRQWGDGRTAKLEDMLDDILAGIITIGISFREKAEEAQREQECKAELERQRKERARQARMDQHGAQIS